MLTRKQRRERVRKNKASAVVGDRERKTVQRER